MRIHTLLQASTIGLLTLVLVAAPSGHEAHGAAAVTDVGGAFLGPDGAPLPFQNDDQILEFLRTAEVIDERPIGKGINGSRKLLLEKDGVRAQAAFREADRTRRNALVEGRRYPVFRDSYLFEPAAYELARLLGIDNVPPAVLRRVKGRSGSVQLWIENIQDAEVALDPPNITAWVQQVRDMVLFDNLIYNSDRNSGNMLTTRDYRLMLIDHTRAFQPKAGLVSPERLTHANRGTWERLGSLTDEEIADAVRPFLKPEEMSMLHIRRRMVLEHLEELIAVRGEGVVIGQPAPPMIGTTAP